MTTYHWEDICNLHQNDNLVREAINFIKGEGYLSSLTQFHVFRFENAPEILKHLCCFNGGDEDWMVVCPKEPEYFPHWIEAMDSCHEPDIYRLENGVIIYVGNHS